MKYLAVVLNEIAPTFVVKLGNPKLMNNVMEKIKIPLPPIEVQANIVDIIHNYENVIHGCKLIEDNYQPSFKINDEWKTYKLSDVSMLDPKKPQIEGNLEVSFLPMTDLNVQDFSVIPHQTKMFSECKGYTYFGVNDVLVAKITPCFENGKMGIVRKLKNNIGFGSTEYYVMRANKIILPEFLFLSICNNEFINQGSNNMSGSAGQKRVTKQFINNYEIKVPNIEIQRKIIKEVECDFEVVSKSVELRKKMQQKISEIINKVFGK